MSFARLIRIATGTPEDRRRSPRRSCRLACTIQRRRKRIPARVLDVSEGGLCLLSPVALEAKERVTLQIEVPPGGPVEVEAIAWHVRRVKGGRRGRKTWSIGMMLSRAGDGFQALLESGRKTAPEAQPMAGADDDGLDERSLAAEELSPQWEQWSAEWDQRFEESEKQLGAAGDDPVAADLRPFHVRVKASAGPRTRLLTLSAASKEEAQALARADLAGSWEVLEVMPATAAGAGTDPSAPSPAGAP